ncbi:MAG: hypothetical protein ACOZIN_14105 [Myxococcota bacterium]
MLAWPNPAALVRMPPPRLAALMVGSIFLAGLVVATSSASFLLPENWTQGTPDFPSHPLARAWVHWDAGWYAQIAATGYWYTPGEQSPVAFFPAYPLVVGAFQALGLNRYHGGILVSAGCGLAALLLFFRWAERLSPSRSALTATALLSLYPFSFFLYGAMYSDALFLLAVVGAFWALEKEQLGWAILLGAIATAARPIAPAVVLGLTVRHFELRKARGAALGLALLLPLLAATGLVAYMTYLGLRFDDPLAFVHTQSAPGWAQGVGWKTWLKLSLFEELIEVHRPGTFLKLAHGLIALGGLALVVPTWRQLGKGYALYSLAAIGIPTLSSKDFMGLGRYTIAAFPLFLTLALLSENRRPLLRWWLFASALGLLLLTAAFAADKYVA